MAEEQYTKVSVLRRCGNIEGSSDRLPLFDTDAKGNIIEMQLDGKLVVLDEIWQQINEELCGQYCNGVCITRDECLHGRTYCYPIALKGKRPNKTVVVMFAWYCADFIETVERATVGTETLYSYEYTTREHAARLAAAARYSAMDAAKAIYESKSTVLLAVSSAFMAADAAHVAAGNTAKRSDQLEAEDRFYMQASQEIERLVAAWGTPVDRPEDNS